MQYKENSPLLMGTSFSCPFLTGLVAQYMQAYFNKFGFVPTPIEVNDFIVENSKPIINDKLKEGNGLLILPSNLLTDYNFGTVIGEKYGNKINVNGTWKTTVNPPMIVNNKLMVELTVLRECKGSPSGTKVYWNDKEKVAIIR